jgi:hypothetical protein
MKIARFRKKPVEIEAIQWDGSIASADAIEAWSSKTACRGFNNIELELAIFIDTPGGSMRADSGDWIIRDVGGFYPCKPDIFEKTYEAV